ncbi:MAG: peptide ABC transporter substrate-binding protein, partial [Clostridia bacterium]
MKRIVALMIVVLMFGTLFTGCQTQPTTTAAPTSFAVSVGGEPKTIDPNLNSAVDGAIYIIHLFEGLTKVNVTGSVVPGIATSWDIAENGT